MKLNKKLLISIVMCVSAFPARAAIQEDIQADSQVLGKWFSEQMGHAAAVNALAGPQLPGDVHRLLGVEVGLSAVASSSKMHRDEFRSLPWTRLQPRGFAIPVDIVLSMPMVHAKVGLPYSLDLGVKYGYINFERTNDDAKSKVKNSTFGVEVRRRLMGEGATGVVLPDVAVSVAYDQAVGDVNRTERYDTALTGGGTLDADTTIKSEWRTGALSARVVASKKIFVFTPYLGAGYSRLFGNTDTTIDVVGTSVTPNDIHVSETSSANADDDLLQMVGGVEFSFFPTLDFNLGGLYSQDDWAATAGLRFSFR